MLYVPTSPDRVRFSRSNNAHVMHIQSELEISLERYISPVLEISQDLCGTFYVYPVTVRDFPGVKKMLYSVSV
jgi:hypothetical protein